MDDSLAQEDEEAHLGSATDRNLSKPAKDDDMQDVLDFSCSTTSQEVNLEDWFNPLYDIELDQVNLATATAPRHFPCSCHKLQLVVMNGLKSCPVSKKLILQISHLAVAKVCS